MIRKPLPFFFVPTLLTALLAGCGSNSATIGTCGSSCPASIAPVSLLYNNTPIQIDVTQLQALSTFLSTVNVLSGTYTSLNLTFANPQLVIYNQSDSSLGSICTVGSICQLTPSFDNNSSSLTFTSSPLPVTVSAYSPLGFLVDFRLNTVIQSDLSVNLSAANGVTITELPTAPTPPQFGFVIGAVLGTTPSLNQFTLQTPWGQPLVIDTTSSTTFNNFPSSACSTLGFGCLAQGQIVKVAISSVQGDGNLMASEVDYVQAAAAQTVEGTVINILPLPTPAGEEIVQMILHSSPTPASGVPIGGVATVTLASSATYTIDNNGFTVPSGLSFTGTADVTVGQNLQLVVVPGTLTSSGGAPGSGLGGFPSSLSFTASTVELEPSQMTGAMSATDSSTTSFTLGVAAPFFAPWPLSTAISSYSVLTTSQTAYTGLNPDNFNGLASNDFISVNGWLFPPVTSAGGPTLAAQSVVLRPNLSF